MDNKEQKQSKNLIVTPEMAKAGGQILEVNYDALPTEAQITATEVFRAMLDKIRESSEPTQ